MKKKTERYSWPMDLKEAFKITLPVMAGYIFLGLAFGFLMRTSGYQLFVPVIMSVLVYSGALQYAAVTLLAAAFDPVSAFIMGLMISARHLFYGVAMLKKYAAVGKIKAFLIFGLTDETFSILSTAETPEGKLSEHFSFFVTLLNFLYWNLGTAAGAVFGQIFTYEMEGLDFVLTALFVVLFIEQLKTSKGLKSGMLGLIASLAVLIIFGSTAFVPLAMALIAVLLIAGRRVIERE